MNYYQISALVVFVTLLVLGLLARYHNRVTARETFGWCTIWIAAAIVTIWPGITSIPASFLGIGRGADLVFYCGIIAMMIGFWRTLVRFRRLERDMTLLVRRLALEEASSSPSFAGAQPPSTSGSK